MADFLAIGEGWKLYHTAKDFDAVGDFVSDGEIVIDVRALKLETLTPLLFLNKIIK